MTLPSDNRSDYHPIDSGVDAQLRQFVAGRDVECPACGYNLRDLPGNRCPECGDQLELGIRLVEPKQGSLIAGLVGLASGAGFAGLLLIYIALSMVIMGRRGGPPLNVFVITCIGLVVHAVALRLWVKNWHPIRRSHPQRRRMLVAFCWVLPLAFIVIFTMFIR